MGSVKGFFQKPIFLIILACIIPNIGGFVGSLFTNDSLQTWFKTLIKPSFNPPGWVRIEFVVFEVKLLLIL